MSKLDTLYLNFERYSKQNPLKGSQLYQLNLYDDRTGAIELLSFYGTEDNPFNVRRQTLLKWKSIPEGAKKLGELLKENATPTDTESAGSTDSRDMAELSSAEESLQS